MKTPPAASIRLGASWHYRAVVLLLTIILIANYLISTSENLLFFFQNSYTQEAPQWGASAALLLATVLALAWAVWDAWAQRLGALHYADGDWVLARGDVEVLGTLQPVLDLPHYILARFTPHTDALSSDAHGNRLAHPQLHNNRQQQWLHLESRHTRHTLTALRTSTPCTAQAISDAAQWQAVRRAVHAQPAAPEL